MQKHVIIILLTITHLIHTSEPSASEILKNMLLGKQSGSIEIIKTQNFSPPSWMIHCEICDENNRELTALTETATDSRTNLFNLAQEEIGISDIESQILFGNQAGMITFVNGVRTVREY